MVVELAAGGTMYLVTSKRLTSLGPIYKRSLAIWLADKLYNLELKVNKRCVPHLFNQIDVVVTQVPNGLKIWHNGRSLSYNWLLDR